MWACEKLAGKQVYLDANVFIYAFEASHAMQLPSRALASIFKMIAAYQLSARTSALTRAEVLVHPLRHGLKGLEADYRLLLSGRQLRRVGTHCVAGFETVIFLIAVHASHQELEA